MCSHGKDRQLAALPGGRQAPQFQAQTLLVDPGGGPCARPVHGQARARLVEQCRVLDQRRAGRAGRQGEAEVAALGNAHVFADQPIRPQLDLQWRLGQRPLHRQGHRQQQRALVAVVHQWPDGQSLGYRPFDLAGLESCWKLPLQLGGQARVARVQPIGVPTLLVHDLQAEPCLCAWAQTLRRVDQQLGLDLLGGDHGRRFGAGHRP